ncbi:MAG: hypothetical protein Kow00121_56790 [Elainellaceae cyanobacterium]
MLKALRRISQVTILLASLGVATAVWYAWHADNWGLTPERAARRDGYCQDAAVMKTQQQTPTSAIVICQGLSTSSDGGYVYVSRLPWGVWWASPSGGNFSYQSSETTSGELVDYIHFGPTQSAYTSLILLGRSRVAEAIAMEAVLSDGRTLRDEVVNNLFVFDAPIQAVGVKVDELRVIGQDNQVLQLIEVKPAY